MNKVSPKSLLQSKWTKVDIKNKEKHFIITEVEYNEDQAVEKCLIEAVITKNQYSIEWRDLKKPALWRIGWQ